MDHYDIVIATPASMMTAAYVRSLAKTISVLNDLKISWHYVNYESPYIRYARESIISYGSPDDLHNQTPFDNQFDYEKIMWIDSDISWEPEDLLKLYYSDKDIVAGAYMIFNGMISASVDGDNFLYPQQIFGQKEIELSTTGFGFVCIKRGVFEKMSRPWFNSVIFEKEGKTIATIGEDNSWCVNARAAGFKIWLDTSVRVIHNKTIPLGWPPIF